MELHELPSGKSFQVWEYRVSHHRLNLRCSRVVPGELEDHNIDIMFAAVRYMELPSGLRELTFDQPTTEEGRYLESRCNRSDVGSSGIPKLPANEMHVLVANGQRYYVVGVGPYIDENNLPMFTSLLEADSEDEMDAVKRYTNPAF